MFSEYKEFITADELAEILRLNVKTVIKLAKENKLPSMKIANQFRFNKEKLIEWIEEEMNVSSEIFLSDFEKTLDDFEVQIHQMADPSHLVLNLHAKDKTEAIKEIVETAHNEGVIKNLDVLLKDIITREEIHTTAVGNGIAFPHPRSVSCDIIRRPLLLMGISQDGIDFGAYDKQPVKMIIVVVIPQLSIHLHVLARLSRIFRDKNVVDRILAANSVERIIDVIKEKESHLDAVEKKADR